MMNQTKLQQRIEELEKQELNKKRLLEEGFERFSENLNPVNIAKHSLLTVVGKVKTAFTGLFKKPQKTRL